MSVLKVGDRTLEDPSVLPIVNSKKYLHLALSYQAESSALEVGLAVVFSRGWKGIILPFWGFQGQPDWAVLEVGGGRWRLATKDFFRNQLPITFELKEGRTATGPCWHWPEQFTSPFMVGIGPAQCIILLGVFHVFLPLPPI